MTTKSCRAGHVGSRLALALLLCSATPALGVQPAAHSYDMPAQPLGHALITLAQQTQVEIIAPAELVEGLSAPALKGRYSLADAIRLLLHGTGLVAERVGDAFIIKRSGIAGQEAVLPAADGEITVTGTRIRGAPIASPVIALDRESARNAGQASLTEIARSIPQNFGGGQNPGVGNNVPEANGVDVGGGASINLRGLGSDATLTLLNGHRLSYSAATQSVDISAIPFDAVERIEIVPDGASALYGSDAVAGVANIILRRDFEGAKANGRWSASTDGGNVQQQYGLTGGQVWGSGGIMAAYEFGRSTRILARQRSYAAEATPGVTLYPFLKHHNALLTGHQALGSGLSFSLDALYNRRWRASEFPLNFAGDLDVSRAESRTSSESFAIAPSLKAELGSGWRLALSGMYGKDRVHFSTDSIFGDLIIPSGDNCYCNAGQGVELGGDGPLFALPGGMAQLALGGGWRDNKLVRTSALNPVRDLSASQASHYAYGELNLPIIAPAQDMAGVHRLNVSAALRYERYPGIDDVATPKLGLIYAPVPGLTLRTSWGRSFRSPTLFQLHQTRSAILALPASLGGGGFPPGATVLLLQGGNAALKPERATSWSASAVIEPDDVPGLRLEIGWFHTRYRDRIVTPILLTAQALADPAYADLIERTPDGARVGAVVDQAQIFTNIAGTPFDPASVAAIIHNNYINAGRQTIKGLDFLANYSTKLGEGTLDVALNASWLDSSQQRSAGQPVTDLAGQIFNPPHLRARASLGWSQGPLNLTASLNHIVGVKDTRFALEDEVAGMTTLDLAARYRIEQGRARGLDLVLSVQNVFNDKPDPIRTTLFYDSPYDSTNYSPVGRFVSLGIAKSW